MKKLKDNKSTKIYFDSKKIQNNTIISIVGFIVFCIYIPISMLTGSIKLENSNFATTLFIYLIIFILFIGALIYTIFAIKEYIQVFKYHLPAIEISNKGIKVRMRFQDKYYTKQDVLKIHIFTSVTYSKRYQRDSSFKIYFNSGKSKTYIISSLKNINKAKLKRILENHDYVVKMTKENDK